MAVPIDMPGNTISVASASFQSRISSTTAEPASVIEFCTSVVGPSVTSVFSASMSLVSREMTTPARVRSKNPSSSDCTWPNRSLRRSVSTRSPTQVVR